MKNFIVRLLINGMALMATATLVDGIHASGFWGAIIAALVLGIVNAIIRPILMVFTFPLNVLTLGLFTFVINAFMLMIVGALVSGFAVDGFFAALLGSVVLSVVSAILSWLLR